MKALLLVGYVAILLISLIMERRIRLHLGFEKAAFTYLFVALIALYYLIDALLIKKNTEQNLFLYFWIFIFISESVLFIHRYRKSRQETSQ